MAMLAGGVAALGLALRENARRRARIEFKGRTVVITGGSRGLGLVLARHLASEGANLALLALDGAELELARQELDGYDAGVMALVCDIRDPEQIEQAFRQIAGHFGRIDILINNAGIIQVGPLEHIQTNDFQDAMAIHFWGPLYATFTAVAYMRRQAFGRIINITSIGGEVAIPHLLPYTASKFAMLGLSDGLRAELSKAGISVTTVTPGLMRTGSHVNALFKGRHRQEYAWFSIFAALPLVSIDVNRAARQIIAAGRYGDPHLVITLPARILIVLNHVFPGLVAGIAKLANRLMPLPEPHWGDLTKTGWDSQSFYSPSFLTMLADQAVARNNQLRGHDPIVKRGSGVK